MVCQSKYAGFFFLGDSLNTTVTVISTLQNEVQEYNTIQLCELLIVGRTYFRGP